MNKIKIVTLSFALAVFIACTSLLLNKNNHNTWWEYYNLSEDYVIAKDFKNGKKYALKSMKINENNYNLYIAYVSCIGIGEINEAKIYSEKIKSRARFLSEKDRVFWEDKLKLLR